LKIVHKFKNLAIMFNFLDTINLFAVSQLLFFSILVIFLNKRIESWKILITFLLVQLLSYGNYFQYRFGTGNSLWIYLITVPAGFMVTPLYFWYIRSRLFKHHRSLKNSFFHSIPALISLFIVLFDISSIKLKISSLSWFSEHPVFNTAQHIQILGYNIAIVFLIHNYKEGIKSYYSSRNFQKIGWIEFLVYSYIITSCLIGALEIIFPINEIMIVSYMIFWLFLNVIFLKAMVLPVEIADPNIFQKNLVKIDDSTVKSVFPRIEMIMKQEKLFLEPELTLGGLSEQIKLSEKTVSQIIRQQTGLHFCDFVNSYRIEFAKKKLVEITDKKQTVLEVLYDSGYNSKSVFNFQFRKFTGKSPSQYRADYFSDQNREKKRPES
jgi:AraC-like DNA-binding protein